MMSSNKKRDQSLMEGMFAYPSICLSSLYASMFSVSVCPSVFLSVYPSVCLSIFSPCSSVYHWPVCLSICLYEYHVYVSLCIYGSCDVHSFKLTCLLHFIPLREDFTRTEIIGAKIVS